MELSEFAVMVQSASFSARSSNATSSGSGADPAVGISAFERSAHSVAALACHQTRRPGLGGVDGTALIIDVRSARQFRQGHIAGSHSIPAARLISSELPDDDLILISERPQQALELIEQLHRDGYARRIQYLDGGVASWTRQGLPLEADGTVGRSLRRTELRPLSGAPLLIAAVSRLLAPLVLAPRLLLRPWGQSRAKA